MPELETSGSRHLLSRLVLLAALIALSLYGVFFIYSTGYIGDAYPVRENWRRQCFFVALGLIVFWVVSHADCRSNAWELFLWCGYGLGVLCLAAVLFVGRETGGARRWLSLGFVQIQPAELSKVFTVLLCVQVLAKLKRTVTAIGLTAVLAGIPFILILLEPSYGNAFAMLPPILAAVMFAKFPRRLFVACAICALLAFCAMTAGLTWLRTENGGSAAADFFAKHPDGAYGLRGYHLRRLRGYLDPRGDWNEKQSVVTIASGGPFGKGYLQGTMKGLGFLPRTVAPTDFILPVIGEELGFVYGCLPVICLYAIILAIAMHWAANANDSACALTCVGVALMLFTNVAVNIGMVVRLIPIIGLPLPLLSYGGSYTVATFIALGALNAAAAQADKSRHNSPDTAFSCQLWRLICIDVNNPSRTQHRAPKTHP